MAVAVRPLAEADRPAWEPLWQAYLGFYESTLPPEVTDLTWSRLLDPSESMTGFVAVDQASGTVIGLCHHLFHRSTWSSGTYCYLEDLFVAPEHRGGGAARALIEATAAAAAEAGATKLYWQTHETNARARRLYDQVAHHDGFLVYERDLT
jgi:GNAT superfamily N-acetyltransferase